MNKTEILVGALKKIVNVRGIENTPAGKIASDALTDWAKSATASPVEEKPEDGLLTRMFQAQYGSRAMSKLIDEHIEEYFTRWPSYKDKLAYLEWYHLFLDFSDKLTESKPSPVIEIGEQKIKLSKLERNLQTAINEAAAYRAEVAYFINLFDTFPSVDVMANSRFVERIRELLKKYPHPHASHPAPALIVVDKYRQALQDIADKVLEYDRAFGDNGVGNHCRNIALEALAQPSIVGEREEELRKSFNAGREHNWIDQGGGFKEIEWWYDTFEEWTSKDISDNEGKGNRTVEEYEQYLAEKFSHPAPIDQALPEEVAQFIKSISSGKGSDSSIIAACGKLYHKMHEEMEQVIESAYAFNRLSVQQANELVELKETLRIASQNETSYRVWLGKSREDLATANALIKEKQQWIDSHL